MTGAAKRAKSMNVSTNIFGSLSKLNCIQTRDNFGIEIGRVITPAIVMRTPDQRRPRRRIKAVSRRRRRIRKILAKFPVQRDRIDLTRRQHQSAGSSVRNIIMRIDRPYRTERDFFASITWTAAREPRCGSAILSRAWETILAAATA
jgi:hypothetical protein